MKHIVTKDKSGWRHGPWKHESDKIVWEEEVTGLPCRLIRNDYGAWCGYVGVDTNHAAFGLAAKDLHHIDVHGGVTFSGWRGNKVKLWYIGFHACHPLDLQPLVRANHPAAEYREADYMIGETEILAWHLNEMEIKDDRSSPQRGGGGGHSGDG